VALSGVKAAQVSLMIKALKAKKLVTQRTSKDDTRVRVIILTPIGVRFLGTAAPLMTALQHQLWPAAKDTNDLIQTIKSTLKRWDDGARTDHIGTRPQLTWTIATHSDVTSTVFEKEREV
jgi:hypothetical protein